MVLNNVSGLTSSMTVGMKRPLPCCATNHQAFSVSRRHSGLLRAKDLQHCDSNQRLGCLPVHAHVEMTFAMHSPPTMPSAPSNRPSAFCSRTSLSNTELTSGAACGTALSLHDSTEQTLFILAHSRHTTASMTSGFGRCTGLRILSLIFRHSRLGPHRSRSSGNIEVRRLARVPFDAEVCC